MNANQQTESHAHVASVKLYVGTFLALVLLTILTVFVSRGVELHAASLPVALAVAAAKISLVLFIFMHVWGENKITILVLISSAFFIALFLGMTIVDTHTRGLGNPVEADGYYRQVNDLPTIMDINAGHDTEATDTEK